MAANVKSTPLASRRIWLCADDYGISPGVNRAFRELFGRAPEFVDGHQHAQLFPVVRDAFLAAVSEHAPGAWVRQGGRHLPLLKRLNAPKALLLDALSAQ